jgi:hypothetical protein
LDFWTVAMVGYFFLSIVLLALNKEYYLYTVKPVLRDFFYFGMEWEGGASSEQKKEENLHVNDDFIWLQEYT